MVVGIGGEGEAFPDSSSEGSIHRFSPFGVEDGSSEEEVVPWGNVAFVSLHFHPAGQFGREKAGGELFKFGLDVGRGFVQFHEDFRSQVFVISLFRLSWDRGVVYCEGGGGVSVESRRLSASSSSLVGCGSDGRGEVEGGALGGVDGDGCVCAEF